MSYDGSGRKDVGVLCLCFRRCVLSDYCRSFMNSLQDIKPLVNGLELLKYTCQDWRTLFCIKNRELLKRWTLAILYYLCNVENKIKIKLFDLI